MRVKKLIKVGLSEGGGVQLDFLLKGEACHECCCEKNILSACVSRNYPSIYLCLF